MRKIIQLIHVPEGDYPASYLALCDDGTTWETSANTGNKWLPVFDPIPQEFGYDWIPYGGGGRPVAEFDVVRVRRKSGEETNQRYAKEFSWHIVGSERDIVAYKVLK